MKADVRQVRIRDDGDPGGPGTDWKTQSECTDEVEHDIEDLVVASRHVEDDSHVHLTTACCQREQ